VYKFDLSTSDGFIRNLKKFWNESAEVVEEAPAHWARLKKDKDSHALVNWRVETHRAHPYLTGHWAIMRDIFDVALIVYIISLAA